MGGHGAARLSDKDLLEGRQLLHQRRQLLQRLLRHLAGVGNERPVLHHRLARQPLGDILAVHLLHGAPVLLADHQLAVPYLKAGLQLQHIGAQRRHAAAPAALPHILQRVQHKAGVAEGRQTAQLPGDIRRRHALIPELGALQCQQAAAGGELAAVHHMNLAQLRQLLRRQQGVLAGAGQLRADVDVDDVVPLLQNGGEEAPEILRADRRGLGQGAVLAVAGIEIRRGIAPVVGEGLLAAADGQRHGADLKPLQKLGRQVAGAVICDANRSVHMSILL